MGMFDYLEYRYNNNPLPSPLIYDKDFPHKELTNTWQCKITRGMNKYWVSNSILWSELDNNRYSPPYSRDIHFYNSFNKENGIRYWLEYKLSVEKGVVKSVELWDFTKQTKEEEIILAGWKYGMKDIDPYVLVLTDYYSWRDEPLISKYLIIGENEIAYKALRLSEGDNQNYNPLPEYYQKEHLGEGKIINNPKVIKELKELYGY